MHWWIRAQLTAFLGIDTTLAFLRHDLRELTSACLSQTGSVPDSRVTYMRSLLESETEEEEKAAAGAVAGAGLIESEEVVAEAIAAADLMQTEAEVAGAVAATEVEETEQIVWL
jgi:hypothetical protein